jgi:hypothetical protein
LICVIHGARLNRLYIGKHLRRGGTLLREPETEVAKVDTASKMESIKDLVALDVVFAVPPLARVPGKARALDFEENIIYQGCDLLNPDLRNSGGFLALERS